MKRDKNYKYLNKYFNKLGLQTEKYTAFNITRLIGEEVGEDAPMDFNMYLAYYLIHLHKITVLNEFDKDILPQIKKQLKKAQKEKLLSVYLATVGYILSRFLQEKAYSELYLGYRETSETPRVPNGYIMIDDKILDLCSFFEEEGESALEDCLYGKYPGDMMIYGWKVDKEFYTLTKYFCKYTKCTVEDMVKDHRDLMLKVIEQRIE